MIRTVACRAFATALLCALGLAAARFPLNPVLLAGALAAYAALIWWRPQLWLLLVPALLPVFDLAPWTGWFFLEELDLLLLATCAVLYWRIGPQSATATLPPFPAVALALVGISAAIAMVLGMGSFPPLDPNSFSNYNSPYNSLRIAKGFFWAVLLLPLMRRSAGDNLANLQRYFVPGMLLGLTLTALCVIWERATFPGLFNFTSDYRPTAPFSAMHTGGAALDAYLAISFPFVALWLAGHGSARRAALGLAVLLLGCYAGLTIFSRDIYLAYGTSIAILLGIGIAYRLRRGAIRPGQVVAAALLVAIFAYALAGVFGSGGYRALLAALLLSGAALWVGIGPRIHKPALCAGAAVVLLVLACGLYAALGKGAYLAFALAFAVFAAGALLHLLGRAEGSLLSAAAIPAMALGTLMVAHHWKGSETVADALIAIVLAAGLIALNRIPAKPIWQLNRASLTGAMFTGVVFAMIIPVAGSYYAGSRFATVGSDIGVRLRHWQEGLDMRQPGALTSLFGMGLGRYPDTYFWHNTHGETPGSFSYQREAQGNLHLRLGTAQYADGFGEVLRMLQHVDVEPGTRYRVALDARRTSDKAFLGVQVCERWLIFPENCKAVKLGQLPADGQWHSFSGTFDSGALNPNGLFARPVQLEMSADGKASYIDVDNVSVTNVASGEELISNGSFSGINDHWFFSSDRNHFPWHAKNVIVYVLFEMGWLGMAALGLLTVGVAGALAGRALHGDMAASVYLAAIAGFLVVGLFDSLFDVPRLTLVFFLVLLAGSLVPKAPPRRKRVRIKRADPEEQDQASPATS